MAPNFIGNSMIDHLRTMQLCESALKVAEKLLYPHGIFLAKLFGGSEVVKMFFCLQIFSNYYNPSFIKSIV
jgi:23S rRNA U2552 (ribose-2'-O)-methylase RlmE/FtsJ